MSDRRGAHLASGIVAGIAGGLVASWLMNEFVENVGPSLQNAAQGKGICPTRARRRVGRSCITRSVP